MATKGGYRPGSGRKSKTEEAKIKRLAIAAIKNKFGSLQNGFTYLLGSNEPSLIKFAFEHAVGKPKDKVDVTSNGESITGFNYIVPSNDDPDYSTKQETT